MVKIGLLGCGHIARMTVIHHSGIVIVAAFDKELSQMQALQEIYPVSIFKEFNDFILQGFDFWTVPQVTIFVNNWKISSKTS